MDLGNSLVVVVHPLLIKKMIDLVIKMDLIVSALVWMVTHWTKPIVSYNIMILGSYDFTKLLYYIISQP